MRGKLNYGDLRTYIRRITPADAGKTNKMIFDELEEWDHPRGCGENQ